MRDQRVDRSQPRRMVWEGWLPDHCDDLGTTSCEKRSWWREGFSWRSLTARAPDSLLWLQKRLSKADRARPYPWHRVRLTLTIERIPEEDEQTL